MSKESQRRRSAEKTRFLKLGLSLITPPGVSRAEAKGVLLDSLRNGSYDLPEGYAVTLKWGNKPSEPTKQDSWQNALAESAANSTGFDKAVENWVIRRFKT